MEITAKTMSARISPRKVRLIADAIRNRKAEEALSMLSVMGKRASLVLKKTLKSAIANAIHNAKKAANGTKIDVNNLKIKRIEVLEGTALKRFHPSTRGRVHPYKKRSSHITIVLEEAYGTKS